MSCHDIDGCFRGDEVNIGDRPYRTTRETALRTGPGEAFDVVVLLRPGQGLGRQTVRNPLADTEPRTSPAGRSCRGPAGFDFEPGVMPSKHGPHATCGSLAFGSAHGRRRVVEESALTR